MKIALSSPLSEQCNLPSFSRRYNENFKALMSTTIDSNACLATSNCALRFNAQIFNIKYVCKFVKSTMSMQLMHRSFYFTNRLHIKFYKNKMQTANSGGLVIFDTLQRSYIILFNNNTRLRCKPKWCSKYLFS